MLTIQYPSKPWLDIYSAPQPRPQPPNQLSPPAAPQPTCASTTAPQSELHGVTTWVVIPTPLTALSATAVVLDLIHSLPSVGVQAPRLLDARRLLRLATVVLMFWEEGSCGGVGGEAIHAGPCRSMQVHAGPCSSMQVHAGPCGSMQVDPSDWKV